MAMLLADVGGTNARLALAQNGAINTSSIIRYRGENYESFDKVVEAYLRTQGSLKLTAVCVAVAGPVSGGKAELTNRNWSFSENRLKSLTNADQVRLINDLTALGYAAPLLGEDGISLLRAAPVERFLNSQLLVVGAGTGFNVCSVKSDTNGHITCMEAEEGHTSLPANIAACLAGRVGSDNMKLFYSTEETFAGRGLSRLHNVLHGKAVVRAEEISTGAMQGDAEAEETYRFFTRLFGLLLRELAMRFMPINGMFLAGSIARSLSYYSHELESAFLAEPYMRHIPENTPLLLIRDDLAALHGCLAAISR